MSDKINYDDFVEDISSGAKAAQEIGKIGLFSRLLGPSFDIIGERLADYLNEKLSKEEKENLIIHQENINKNNLNEDSSIEAFSSYIIWINRVKNIDPKRMPNSTKIWRTAINNALANNNDLINTLNKMPDKIIEAICTTDSHIDESTARYLERIGFGRIKIDGVKFNKTKKSVNLLFISQFIILSSVFLIIQFGSNYVLREHDLITDKQTWDDVYINILYMRETNISFLIFSIVLVILFLAAVCVKKNMNKIYKSTLKISETLFFIHLNTNGSYIISILKMNSGFKDPFIKIKIIPESKNSLLDDLIERGAI